MSRRDQVLDAAVGVLGSEGPRGLTHRAVDRAAGVAEGTTSNHFRTRQALLEGVVDRVVARESAVFAQLGLPPGPLGEDDLVRVATEMTAYLLGPGRPLSRARYAVFLEAAHRPQVGTVLAAGSALWWSTVGDLLARAGSSDPVRHARLLLACIDGLILDQLARPDPSFDAAAAVRTVLRGLLPAARPNP